MPDINGQEPGEQPKLDLVARITEIAEKAGEPKGIEIVEVHVLGAGKARTVRIFIDKPEGITHDDCQWISSEAGAVLDEQDVVPGPPYTLEVSSPGVERKLSKPRDFERFTGQKAKLVLREPLENQRCWEGTLSGFAGGVVSLEASPGKKLEIPLAMVEKANLKFEW